MTIIHGTKLALRALLVPLPVLLSVPTLANPAIEGVAGCQAIAAAPAHFTLSHDACQSPAPATPAIPASADANARIAQPAIVSIALPAGPRARQSSRRAAPATQATAPGLTASIRHAAYRHRIDPALLASLVAAESGFRIDARSPKGALGLTQVMPDTARSLGIADPEQLRHDPILALDAGARYLKQLQRRFGNNLPLVLAGYNAGPGAVARHAGIPPYQETRHYVRRVLADYAARRAGPP